jgi:hypothetical protein
MDLLGKGVCLRCVSSVRIYLCREDSYWSDENILKDALLLRRNVNKPTTHFGWVMGLCRELREGSSISYLHCLSLTRGKLWEL